MSPTKSLELKYSMIAHGSSLCNILVHAEHQQHFKVVVSQKVSAWSENLSSHAKQSLSWCAWQQTSVLLDEHILYKWMTLQTADVTYRVIQIQFELWLHNAALVTLRSFIHTNVSSFFCFHDSGDSGSRLLPLSPESWKQKKLLTLTLVWMNERRVTQK